jgi:hypothetical protein
MTKAKTLRDIDQFSLEVNKYGALFPLFYPLRHSNSLLYRYDGAALEPAYIPPKYTGPEPVATLENPKIYTGSCHCGAVTLELKTSGPLSSYKGLIQECNCSICMRVRIPHFPTHPLPLPSPLPFYPPL